MSESAALLAALDEKIAAAEVRKLRAELARRDALDAAWNAGAAEARGRVLHNLAADPRDHMPPEFCADEEIAAAWLAGWAADAAFVRLAEVERERDEALLTLAAEQGRQEGAPSKRWHYVGNEDGFDEERGEWRRRDNAVKVWWDNGRWIWGRRAQPGVYVAERGQPDDQPARAAMLAADAATG